MRDIAEVWNEWVRGGRAVAVATVVHTSGSSPRPLGSLLVVRDDGISAGSVSGGCVETAVLIEAMAALDGGPPRALEFGELGDRSYWDVGLSCGGSIGVWVEKAAFEQDSPSGTAWWEFLRHAADGTACVRIASLDAERPSHAVWTPDGVVKGDSDAEGLVAAAAEAYALRESRQVECEGRTWFLHVLRAPDRLIVIGAVHIAVPLVRIGRDLGFETIVIDPREAYATLERFGSEPDALVHAWPHEVLDSMGLDEDTYAVLLTHDPKIDDPALEVLLRSEVGYIGILGGRSTHAARRERLAEAGLTEAELDRIHGPVGLAIGARTPDEIALSILAEIVKVKRG